METCWFLLPQFRYPRCQTDVFAVGPARRSVLTEPNSPRRAWSLSSFLIMRGPGDVVGAFGMPAGALSAIADDGAISASPTTDAMSSRAIDRTYARWRTNARSSNG